MAVWIEIAYVSGAVVRGAASFADLATAASAAFQLANEAGQTFSQADYGPAVCVKVLRDEIVELNIRVFMGGLSGETYEGLVVLPD